MCLAESQVMYVHLQRLAELAIDHDPKESSALAKLAFHFTSASASRRLSALTGVTAHSRRQVQESRRKQCFMMAWYEWCFTAAEDIKPLEEPAGRPAVHYSGRMVDLMVNKWHILSKWRALSSD